jgi:hypothetical protein
LFGYENTGDPTMKKILVSFVAIMAVASSAMAAETMNMHDQVNNAQAPAHQMQSSAEKVQFRETA